MPIFDAATSAPAQHAERVLDKLIDTTIDAIRKTLETGRLCAFTPHGITSVDLPPVIDTSIERYTRTPSDAGPVLTAIGIPVSDARIAHVASMLSRVPVKNSITIRMLPGDRVGYEDGDLPQLFLKALGFEAVSPTALTLEQLLPAAERLLEAPEVQTILLDDFPATPSLLARALDRMKGCTR